MRRPDTFRISRAQFCSGAATALVSSSLGTRGAIAQTLPAQDELAVLAKLGSLMEGVYPRGAFPNPDGASEANKSGYIQVGFQYETFALVPYAIGLKSTRFLDALLRVAEYAFAHQHPDGRFDYSESNGTVTTGSVQGPLAEASTATTFFSDFGHTLILLPKDPWFATSPECATYRRRLSALRQKCGISLDWLLSQKTLLPQDHAASNRTLAHAMAYYFLGRVLDNAEAMATGRNIFLAAIRAQTPDGVFLENGGFDSSYQMTNVLYCEWIYLCLDPSDADIRPELWQAIGRGIARERPSVLPSGEVETAGNSRITESGEVYLGHRKTVNSKQVIAGLGYYGVMASDPGIMATTRRVYHYYYPADKIDF